VRVTHLGKKAVKGNRPYQLARAEDRGLPATAVRLRMETDRQKLTERRKPMTESVLSAVADGRIRPVADNPWFLLFSSFVVIRVIRG